MTLQLAAEQGLRELRRLHVESGECSHPHECPVVKAITDLELALDGLKVKPAGHESCKTCHGTGFVDFWGQLFPCNAKTPDDGKPAIWEAEPLHPETLAAIGRMRCPLPEQP